MNIIFQMNADSVNALLLDAIKACYTGKEIEISIKESSISNSKIIYEPSLLDKTSSSTATKKSQKNILLLNEQRIESIDDQIKKILRFIRIFEIKKILYLGLGLKDIIEPIAKKNIDTSIVGGKIGQIAGVSFFWDEEEFPDSQPPQYPDWSQNLPLFFPQEGVPHVDMWIVDALNCSEKSYIEHCLNKDGSDDNFNELPKFLIVLNHLDITHFPCYNAYFWLESGSIKIGLDERHCYMSDDHFKGTKEEL